MTLKVTGLHYQRGSNPVLIGLDLEVQPGGLTILVGPNGAGKSTLLQCLCGLLKPGAGERFLNGKPLESYKVHELARELAWVPTHQQIPFELKCIDIVLLGRFPMHQGFPGKADHRKASEAMSRLEIADFKERPFQSLSSGEQKKVMIARALASDAPLFIFDEPCANLDIAAAIQLLKVLKELAGQGKTILVAIHDLALARRFGDEIIVLSDRRVRYQGPPAAAFREDLMTEVFKVQRQEVDLGTNGTSMVIF